MADNTLQSPNDESLVARICDGDYRAFAILVERHNVMFFQAAYRMCGNVQDAEDSVQDAFLKFWKRPQAFDPLKGVKFTTWFYRVVSNAAIDLTRKNSKRAHGGDEALAYVADGAMLQDSACIMTQEQQNLETAIASLPERQKLALNLCVYDGLSNKEAAQVLGVGVKALESLLMRAKASLKQTLAGGVNG